MDNDSQQPRLKSLIEELGSYSVIDTYNARVALIEVLIDILQEFARRQTAIEAEVTILRSL